MSHFRIREWQHVNAIECIPMREAGFIAGFSTRLGGVSPLPVQALNLGYFHGDVPENVQENRRRYLAAFNLEDKPYQIVTAKQIHSADSYLVSDLHYAKTEHASCDALLTKTDDLILGIQTADCLPALIVDRKTRAVAGAHAGWRGALARIVELTIARMTKELGTNPADCLVATGPTIGTCCFEVGPEVVEAFTKEFSYGESLFSNHQANGKAHLDLRAANRQQILDSGVPEDQIFIWEDCTRCNVDRYFSYRKEKDSGRVGRLLAIVGRI